MVKNIFPFSEEERVQIYFLAQNLTMERLGDATELPLEANITEMARGTDTYETGIPRHLLPLVEAGYLERLESRFVAGHKGKRRRVAYLLTDSGKDYLSKQVISALQIDFGKGTLRDYLSERDCDLADPIEIAKMLYEGGILSRDIDKLALLTATRSVQETSNLESIVNIEGTITTTVENLASAHQLLDKYKAIPPQEIIITLKYLPNKNSIQKEEK
jgi:hypothetical protein